MKKTKTKKKKQLTFQKRLHNLQKGRVGRGTIFVVVIMVSLMFGGYLFVGGTIPETIPAPRSDGIVSISKPSSYPQERSLQMHTFYGVTNTPFPTQGELKPLPETGSAKLTILFDFDKTDIKTEYNQQLDDLATQLKDPNNASKKVRIVGHTDKVDTQQYNITLSQNRALKVRDYLVSKGIPQDRFTIEGKGETEPAGDAASSRRVEIFF